LAIAAHDYQFCFHVPLQSRPCPSATRGKVTPPARASNV
jgi:hypothetical protein